MKSFRNESMQNMTCWFSEMPSPLGPLFLFANEVALTHVYFSERVAELPRARSNETAVLVCAQRELGEYFKGTRTHFTVPLAPSGTEFQKLVWSELTRISFGTTASYSALASAVKNPQAVRAVGGANRNNPISIIVPCHRVIGKSGQLVGYAGGVSAKKWLLEFERSKM
jgi:methylated-DNA-[protein]-cysteine S-methyltransferase